MGRKLTVLSVLGFISLLAVAGFIVRAASVQSSINGQAMRVHNLDTGLSYATIQEAIDASETSDGDRIFVESGVYYENVIVHKSLFLLGENVENTVIDGNSTGNVVSIIADNVSITGFTIQNGSYLNCGIFVSSNFNNVSYNRIVNNGKGIWLNASSGNVLLQNYVADNDYGIELQCSNDNSISNNNITKNRAIGIYLYESSHNNVCGNYIANNKQGIWVYAFNNFSRNNLIAGNNITKNSYSGIRLWPSSTCNLVYSNEIRNNANGVWIYSTCNNTIYRNNLVKNYRSGIGLEECCENLVFGNNLLENDYGVWIMRSFNNSLYHNNFADNIKQVHVYGESLRNFWDDGLEGNYWSNYTGVDLNYDGIGDSAYEIDENNTDHYPLMGLFHVFDATQSVEVCVISNSTIQSFEYFEFNGTIRLTVSNMTVNQTCGFCRVCIPHVLMDVSNVTVIIDGGSTTPLYFNNMTCDNGTHRWIYFAYPHSTHVITIIPEFLHPITLTLLIATVFLAVTRTLKIGFGCREKQEAKE